jgi:hypothetical protein
MSPHVRPLNDDETLNRTAPSSRDAHATGAGRTDPA